MVAGGCAKAAGLETRIAHSCAEFRTVYGEFSPDVVITDIVMPDEDGLDVLRFLWSAKTTAKVILISANVAALNFAVLSFHTLRLNRALLPEPLRPPRWREAVVALGGLGFAGLALLAAAAHLGWLPAPGR